MGLYLPAKLNPWEFTTMTFMQALEDQLTVDEGKRYKRYLDSRGIPTIGIGHNLNASPLPAGWTEPLTDAQVDQLFQQDIAGTLSRIATRLPWVAQQPQAIQLALSDMGFNMGVGQAGPPATGLMGFHTFLGLVQAGNYSAAADDLVGTLWAKQVGNRATRIEAQIRAAA
jgi:lysozyme